jgi:hypothetical protein
LRRGGRDRVAAELRDQARLLDPERHPHWVLERGSLAFRGRDITAFFAEVQGDMVVRNREPFEGVPLLELRKRAEAAGLKVGQLEVKRGDRSLAYASEEDADVIHDEELAKMIAAFGVGAPVRKASAVSPSQRHIPQDFETLTAGGKTVARFPLNDLAYVAFIATLAS